MSKLKVAILEDSKVLLKELKENVEATGLVNVVAWDTSSAEFIEKVKATNPDALLLDIDLAGDERNGIEVAHKLGKPVLFVSGKTTEFNNKIEFIDMQSDFIVDRIGKTYSQETLKKKLSKFIAVIQSSLASRHTFLDILHHGRTKIETDTIVYNADLGAWIIVSRFY